MKEQKRNKLYIRVSEFTPFVQGDFFDVVIEDLFPEGKVIRSTTLKHQVYYLYDFEITLT